MKYLLLFSFITSLLFAAPAFQGKRIFTQPDGTVVTYQLQGDEHLNWVTNQKGDILLFSKENKRLEFAEIKDGRLKTSGVPFTEADATNSRAASAVTWKKPTREELNTLHQERRDARLSKMKNRHPAH